MEELGRLLDQVNKEWKKIDNRVIGHIIHSPPIGLGVSEQHFTEDWGVFVVDRATVTVSRAIKWISVRFDCATKTY